MKKRNKAQARAYAKVSSLILGMIDQWVKNKNGKPLETVTISRAQAESALICSGEIINGVKVNIK